MKATLCDIDGCRKDAYASPIELQYYGTPAVFQQAGYQPESSKIVLQTPYTHAENVSEVASILQRPFDLCWDHQMEIALGSRIKNWWTSTDRNPQDEHFTVQKMKRDRE